MPRHLARDCRFSASRYDLVEALPTGGRIAEVGTYKGDFARHILAHCDPAELHLVDLDFSLLDPVVAADTRIRKQGCRRPVARSVGRLPRSDLRLGLHRRRSFLRWHDPRRLCRRSEGQTRRLSRVQRLCSPRPLSWAPTACIARWSSSQLPRTGPLPGSPLTAMRSTMSPCSDRLRAIAREHPSPAAGRWPRAQIWFVVGGPWGVASAPRETEH